MNKDNLRTLEINQILRSYRDIYVDVRSEFISQTSIHYINGSITAEEKTNSIGYFIRVNINGVWVQQYTNDFNEIESILKDLKEIGSSLPICPMGIINPINNRLIKKKLSKENFSTLKTSIKKNILEKPLRILKENPFIVSSHLIYKDRYIKKVISSTLGSEADFDINQACISSRYGVGQGKRVFRDEFDFFFVKMEPRLNKVDEYLNKNIKESIKFINAEKVDPGNYNLVLGSEVVGGFIHECFGHRAEADFQAGNEFSKRQWIVGEKKFPDFFTVVDDNNLIEHAGYTPYDDEGTRGKKTFLVKKGVITSRLHSIDTAIQFNEKLSGNARAISIKEEPIVRMTNTYLQAGSHSFNQLLNIIQNGYYVKSFRSGSGLGGFNITPIKTYKVVKGKITIPVLIDIISGDVDSTINSIIGCSNKVKLFSSLIGGCSKGGQSDLPVAFGGPSVALNNVEVK